MKKIILCLMIFSATSLFATDVSNFDIKGIKLGMSKDEAIRLMKNYCKNIQFTSNGKYTDGAYTKCSNKQVLSIELGYNQVVHNVSLSINKNYLLSSEQITTIINKLLKKYGKYSDLGKQKSIQKKHGNMLTACWGIYKKKHINNSYWRGTKIECTDEEYLYLEINSNPYGNTTTYILLSLVSNNLYRNQKQYYNKKIQNDNMIKEKQHTKEIKELDF